MEYKKIGEITSVLTGGTPSTAKKEYWNNGDIPWLQSGCCQNCDVVETEKYITKDGYDNSNAKIMPPETVMIALTGATAGKVGFLKFQACGNQSITGILPCETMNQRFIFYYLISKRKKILADCIGGAQPHISQEYVKNIPIPIPSLKTQNEIVEHLTKLNLIIETRINQLKLFDELIKARFVEMFGNPEHSEKYPYMAVREFTDVVSGGTPDRKNTSYWDNGTVPWVKTTELHNNRIDAVEEFISEKGLAESSAKVVPKGTVLIAMYGQGKTRGMTAILGISAATNQACACLLPSETVESMYLWYYMIMSYDRLRNLAQGGNQPNLNGNMIKNFTVLIPPKEVQLQFVKFLEQVDKSKVVVQKSLDETQTLFDSLMQKYFG